MVSTTELLRYVENELVNKSRQITFEDALNLYEIPYDELLGLMALARRVTLKYNDNNVILRSIINVKSGNCSEDCSFCSQSAHYQTTASVYDMLKVDKVLEIAEQAEKMGALDLCLVMAVKSMTDRQLDKILEYIMAIKSKTDLLIGCSLGMLEKKQANKLSSAGVWRYNHNLESCEEFFGAVCTTHEYKDRVNTANLVNDTDMKLCCGGMIGIGETPKQRIKLAFEIKRLNPHTVPINFLDPRPGTPLSNLKITPGFEALKIISIFRLILPTQTIMLAGGRERALRDLQPLGILAGSNGIIIGNYLTTIGRQWKDDINMLKNLQVPLMCDREV
jgi:biotin synthase